MGDWGIPATSSVHLTTTVSEPCWVSSWMAKAEPALVAMHCRRPCASVGSCVFAGCRLCLLRGSTGV